MHKKNVSVIIPAYNAEKYIASCLDSVLCQIDVNFEIVCVNDGSTDRTQSIIEGYCKKNSDIKLINQKNCGLSASRNVGMENSEGEYIYFLDADDLLASENVLSYVYQYCVKKQLDFVHFDAKSFFESEEIKEKNPYYVTAYQRDKEYGYYDSGINLLTDIVAEHMYYQSACLSMFKRSFLNDNDIHFLEGVFFEDNIFTLQCFLKARKVMHLKFVVMSRRVHENSIMQSRYIIDKFHSLCQVYFECLNIWQMSTFDEDANNTISMIVNEIKNQARYYYHNLSETEKSKINRFACKERYRIQNEILNEERRLFLNEYIFPYHLFEQNDNVIIYGAGNIGKIFYRIAKFDQLLNIKGVVDRRGRTLSEDDIVVVEPEDMLGCVESKWLIAIENKDVACDVREYLLNKGISEEKIVWDGNNYLRSNKLKNDFIKRRLRVENNEYDGPRMFLFMQPEHGNLGDYAISMGEVAFLNKFFSQYRIIKITTNEWIENKEIIEDIVCADDIILMNGGGYIGNIWESWKISKEILNCFCRNIKILFPNNFTYAGNENETTQNLLEDLSWLKEQERLFLFFRGKQSFTVASEYLKKNVYYAPDMALFLDVEKKRSVALHKALLCFRSDKEKLLNNEDVIVSIIKKEGFLFENRDIHMNKYVPLKEGYIEVYNFIEYLRTFEIVLTDRLHCAILCVLSGVPCIAFDNITHKIKDVSEWLRCDYFALRDMNNFSTASFEEVLKNEEGYYDRPMGAFAEMAKIIDRILSEG